MPKKEIVEAVVMIFLAGRGALAMGVGRYRSLNCFEDLLYLMITSAGDAKAGEFTPVPSGRAHGVTQR